MYLRPMQAGCRQICLQIRWKDGTKVIVPVYYRVHSLQVTNCLQATNINVIYCTGKRNETAFQVIKS